ncbi:HWE histidine kinase domain-containing protein [Jiella sp. M17.18]|uniref:HWE histidine kinase domain-containing protein n=1 Tax=Jiella sp. M17.18 TaxID=3234247 RepID=UPI0034DEBD94
MAFDADAVHAAPGQMRDADRPAAIRPRSFSLSRLMRRPPLIAHLVAFGLTVLVPALLFSAFLILQFSDQQKQIAAAQVNDTAEIVSNAVDREIYGLITMGRVLAASPALESGHFDTFQERILAALRNTQTSAELVDRSMQVLVATRSDLPPADNAVFDDTATVDRAFATMRPIVSGVSFRKSSGQFVYHVAVPVMRGQDPLYVLVLTKAATSFESVIADRNLPREWSAIIKDSEGHRVFAAVTSGGKMESRQGISYDNPSIIEAIGSGASTSLIEASTVSSLSGWTTTVAVPSAVIDGPTYRSWILLLGAGFLLLAFSVALGIIFGRRIAEPILALANQAEQIGKGRPANTISTDIAEVGQVSKVLAQASRERREAEEQNRFLMREMTHRAKNQYALIAAIARRAAKESADTGQFLDTLSEALASLARSADLLAGRGWHSVDMEELIAMQLKAFGSDSEQIDSCGVDTPLNSTAAQTIGLALHELATNAAKYGALSKPEGRVRISWSLTEVFTLVWRESGGPPVVPPKRSGFGTLVTQKMTARGLGGTVDMDYAPGGVVWTLTAPAETILARD